MFDVLLPLPLLVLVDGDPADAVLELDAPERDAETEDELEVAVGILPIVDQVPPLVVVLGLYARNATLPSVVSWTRALVEAL